MIGLAFAAGAIVAFGAFRHAGIAVLAIVIFAYLSVLMVAIAFLLDHPRHSRQPRTNEAAEDLAKRNLLLSTSFCADRAFRVDERNDEGPHYFLELQDGGVLHLSGNYLYEYEPGDGSPRHFPCTRFTLRRHAELGQVIDILCEGLIIEPEVEAPPYTEGDFARRLVPADGEILRNLTFEQLRQQRAGARYRIH
jgi:hypothetical protein